MGLAQIELDLRVGKSSVVVNGQDIADLVSRITVEHGGHGVGRIPWPQVYLEAAAELQIEGEGIVHVVRPVEGNPVLAFLESVDVEALELSALENVGALDGDSVGASFLRALKELASDGD